MWPNEFYLGDSEDDVAGLEDLSDGASDDDSDGNSDEGSDFDSDTEGDSDDDVSKNDKPEEDE